MHPVSYPTVHIGIVTYNSEADLERCIRAIQALTYPNLEVTILDNGSADRTAIWLESTCPEIRLIRNLSNIGYGQAHNQILSHIHLRPDDYYLALNPDVSLAPDYALALVTALQSTGCGWAIGKLTRMDSEGKRLQVLDSAGLWMRRDGLVINRGEGLADGPEFSEQQGVFCASGAAMLISARLIEDIAPDGILFDSAMFMYAEDVDMGWRARLQGWGCLYVPGAEALHRGGVLDPQTRLLAITNNYLSIMKNAFLVDLVTFNIPVIVASCLFRLLVSPRRGLQLINNLIRLIPHARQGRRQPRVKRSEMLRWFQSSKHQPTSQPITFRERARAYLSR